MKQLEQVMESINKKTTKSSKKEIDKLRTEEQRRLTELLFKQQFVHPYPYPHHQDRIHGFFRGSHPQTYSHRGGGHFNQGRRGNRHHPYPKRPSSTPKDPTAIMNTVHIAKTMILIAGIDLPIVNTKELFIKPYTIVHA